MKKLILMLSMAALVVVSCHKKESKSNTVEENTVDVEQKNPLSELKFDNTIDFYCKMDISKHGVSDTLTYKGKLYGFCSTMCKEEFLLKPEEYLAKQ